MPPGMYPLGRTISPGGRILPAVGALLFGIKTAMGLIEGQLSFAGLTMMIGVAVYLVVANGQKRQRPRFDIACSPVQFFLVTAFLAV